MLNNTTKSTINMEEVSKFKVGDKVKYIKGLTEYMTGIPQDELIEYQDVIFTIEEIDEDDYYIKNEEFAIGYYFTESQLVKEDVKMNNNISELIKQSIREEINNVLNEKKIIPIKYHDSEMPKMIKNNNGNWIDCRVIEGGKVTFDIGTPNERKEKINWIDCERKLEDGTIEHTKKITYQKGDFLMLPLGFSINQGLGYEVNILPRSSTFKNFHIVQANSMAVGDDTFIGDGDMYHYPAIALADGEMYLYDRICQMQINKTTNLELKEVDSLGQVESRGGFGQSGVR